MAPPSDDSPPLPAGAISNLLIVIAMQTEALPLVNKFHLVEAPSNESIFPKGAPWIRYHGNYKGLHIDLVWPGKDPVLGVDCVGTVSAALVTYASIQSLKPDLIINAGTAGGFKAKGAGIGDVFLASDVAFHDRRIPIPVFDMYGIGTRKTFATPNILKELNLKVGKLSTGDSLDMSPHDESAIQNNDATVKDMEGAAVAYVADMFSTPAIFVKAVTDIVDGEKPTAEEFLQNLVAVTAALDKSVTEVMDSPSKQMMQADASYTNLTGIIKPKVESCDDDDELLPAPPASGSEDWEVTTPIGTGNPFFTTVISRSHLRNKYQMWVPHRFQRRLPEARTGVVLHCGGKSWPASYCGDLKVKKIDVAGWSNFAVDNRLRVGDACVFELIAAADTHLELKVQILRGDLPEEVTSKGATSDEPILIDD
uniref:TF-B3 domain-containing protein n=1 Tax=Leersia perrieri TaxID=77586 RepID=A0A0D9WKZ4_9ORYZ